MAGAGLVCGAGAGAGGAWDGALFEDPAVPLTAGGAWAWTSVTGKNKAAAQMPTHLPTDMGSTPERFPLRGAIVSRETNTLAFVPCFLPVNAGNLLSAFHGATGLSRPFNMDTKVGCNLPRN